MQDSNKLVNLMPFWNIVLVSSSFLTNGALTCCIYSNCYFEGLWIFFFWKYNLFTLFVSSNQGYLTSTSTHYVIICLVGDNGCLMLWFFTFFLVMSCMYFGLIDFETEDWYPRDKNNYLRNEDNYPQDEDTFRHLYLPISRMWPEILIGI